MNLEQAVTMSKLEEPGKIPPAPMRLSALEMAERVFTIAAQAGSPYEHITAKQWAKRWLASPVFVLMDVDTDKVALLRTPRNPTRVLQAMATHAGELEPLVVDVNKQGLRAPGTGYQPPVIAVDGAHRAYGQYLQGRETVRAWVGIKAASAVRQQPPLPPQPRKYMPNGYTRSTPLATAAMLHAAQGMSAPPRQDAGDGGPSSTSSLPTAHASTVPTGPKFIKDRGVKAEMGVQRLPGGSPMPLEARDFSQGRRKKLAKTGDAMPGGGFPIVNKEDLANAKQAIGRAKNRGATIAHINKRAKALGAKPFGKSMASVGGGTGAAGSAGTGGPGGMTSGPTPPTTAMPLKAARRTPEAISTRQLEQPDPSDTKVPPDPSDEGQSVDPSDRLQYEDEPQQMPPGVRHGRNEVRSKDNPMWQSPGSGVGPRLDPDRGASSSEMVKKMAAGGPGSGRRPSGESPADRQYRKWFQKRYGKNVPVPTQSEQESDLREQMEEEEADQRAEEGNQGRLGRRMAAKGKKVKDCKACGMDLSAAGLRNLFSEFKAAVKAGYVGEINNVSPPGCEHVVKGLKKAGHDKASAFKIAWWSHNQGRC